MDRLVTFSLILSSGPPGFRSRGRKWRAARHARVATRMESLHRCTERDKSSALLRVLNSCRSTGCEREVRPDSDDVVRLAALVEKGQRRAIDAAFASTRVLDGGDPEDIHRSLGVVADTSPRCFLEQVRKHRYSTVQITRSLVMTSLDLVDNLSGKLAALRSRLHSIAGVRDRHLERVRADAVLSNSRELALEESGGVPAAAP